MRRYLEILPAALLLAVHFVIAASLENLYGNRMEFEFGSSSILPSLVLIALALIILLCLLGAVLPAAIRSRYVAVIFALGCLGWVQSSFLHGDYGQFTGEAIDWSGDSLRGWLDLLLWVGGITAALKYHRSLRPAVGFVAPLLVVLELAGLGGRAMLVPAEAPPVGEEVVASSLSQFSRHQNVVHILMDAFQTGVFLELVQEEELEDDFDGFTAFRENMAVAAYTAMSIPAIFSGEIYDGTETPSQYHHRALRQHGFYHRLFDEGYAVNLIPKIPMYGDGYTLYAETPSHYGLSRSSRLRQQTAFLLDLNLFRSSPHFLRPVIHNDGNWRLRKSLGNSVLGLNTHQRAFFADYIDQLQVVFDEPAYHFIHLLPPHDPFVTLPDGTDAGRVLPNTRENYKNEARYTLRLFVTLLERMHDLGIYDSALIVLHADHGIGAVAKHATNPHQLKMPRAPALLAIKRIGAHGPLEVTDAPTSVADIPATIMGELGFEHEYEGQSVFGLTAGPRRTRIFNSYSLGAGSTGLIRSFQVKGSVYDPQAWSLLGDRAVNLGQPIYEWGSRVEFGVGSDCDRYLGPNWSSGGAGGCRINLKASGTINLQAEPTQNELRAVFEFRPRLREGEQRRFGIRLHSNGEFVGELSFHEPRPERFEFLIPAGHAGNGNLDLEFEFLDFGSDKRGAALSLCLMSMQLELMPRH